MSINTMKNNPEQHIENKNKKENTDLLTNLEKSNHPEAKKLSESFKKDIEQLDKEKENEIKNHLENHWKWHKLSSTEIKLQQEKPRKIDYSNSEHIKKHCKLIFIKQARIIQEEKIA